MLYTHESHRNLQAASGTHGEKLQTWTGVRCQWTFITSSAKNCFVVPETPLAHSSMIPYYEIPQVSSSALFLSTVAIHNDRTPTTLCSQMITGRHITYLCRFYCIQQVAVAITGVVVAAMVADFIPSSGIPDTFSAVSGFYRPGSFVAWILMSVSAIGHSF